MTRLPHQSSSSTTSCNGTLNLEEELAQTSLRQQGGSSSTERELQETAVRLQEELNGSGGGPTDMGEAYKALEKAQEELNKMR